MASPKCFCCRIHKDLGHGQCDTMQSSSCSRTELDMALHELGMLSTVTNSRKEYIKEKGLEVRFDDKVPTCSSSESLPCIVQMNSNFVTDFSFSALVTSNGSNFEHDLASSSTSSSSCKRGMLTYNQKAHWRKLRRKTINLYRPYDFPWKPKLIKSLEKQVEKLKIDTTEVDGGSSTPSLAIVTRQDSGGNKSNPGSPVKSQKPISSTGCSIVRSRSLDDLEISKLNLTECCSNEAGRAEIDTVSQRINNLHVS